MKTTTLFLIPILAAFADAPRASAADPLPPGAIPCVTNAAPPDYGTFLLIKSSLYAQNTDALPIPATGSPAQAQSEFRPPTAYAVLEATVVPLGGTSHELMTQPDGSLLLVDGYPTEAELDTAYPSGEYATVFELKPPDQPAFSGIFPFTLTNGYPSVPQVGNVSGAQAIDPSQPFNVTWNAFTNAIPGDRIGLEIVDSSGRTVVASSTDCATPPLLLTSTNLTIAAGALSGGSSYSGFLSFGHRAHVFTNVGAVIVENAWVSRTTRFPLRTTGGATPGPATTTNATIVGTNLQFTIIGDPNATYVVQSSPDFVTWTDVQTNTIPASGSIEVSIPIPADAPSLFYRVVGRAAPPGPGEPAELGIRSLGTNQLEIIIQGVPGVVYSLERSTNYTEWIKVADVPIPASGEARVTVDIAGLEFAVFRAVATGDGPAPPGAATFTGISSAAADSFRLLLSGDPNRAYTIENSTNYTAWNSVQEVTMDAAGRAEATINAAGQAFGIYRAVGR